MSEQEQPSLVLPNSYVICVRIPPHNPNLATSSPELAQFNQQEFLKSGTEGKCIEARELIIALPESFPDLYDPDRLLQMFTNRFKEKYGVKCVSALHHNKRKTNYHVHLIFSERELLPEPIEKIATRNMFYNEQKKHVRTKKEILDDSGNVRKGCKIIKKGEVYERTLFTAKNKLFKQKHYLDEAKHERNQLEIEMSDLKGIARLTKKKELESRIATKNEKIRTLKAELSGIVKQHGFATVQDFYTAFYTAKRATDAYQIECAKWEEAYGEKSTPKPKPCTKRYNGIKKKLTDNMPTNLTEAEIKGRDNRP